MKELAEKKELIRQLQEKILGLEGFMPRADGRQADFGLGPVNGAFPGGIFPTGVIHEFSSPAESCIAAANGFIAGLLHTLMKKKDTCLWISARRRLFPPALKLFGIEPHRFIFVDVKGEKEVLWALEQGLKCPALAAVVAELREVDFAESRRLQLAVEDSHVTGFLHRCMPRTENTLACVSRWKISPLPSLNSDGLPGVGFPQWKVELLKIRNGKPGTWQMEWRNGTFALVPGQRHAAPAPRLSGKEQQYA